MEIAMSVVFDDYSYYSSFPENAQIIVGEQHDADVHIPNFGRVLSIKSEQSVVNIQITEGKKSRNILVPLDEFVVIDYSAKIVAYFTEASICNEVLTLPPECSITFGRHDESPKNDVVIGMSFISSRHFRLVREGGRTFVSDVGSKNGLYLNGERITNAELHSGDRLSVFTLCMILSGNKLYFLNAAGKLILHTIVEPDKRKAAPLKPSSTGYHMHSRSPRLITGVNTEVINIEKPPQTGGTPKINWLSILVAPMISVALMVVLVFAMGMSAVMLIMSGAMSVVSAIIAVINYRTQKKQHRETGEVIDEKYRKYLSDVSEKLEDAHRRQLASLVAANPSPGACLEIACSRSRQLWERRPVDEDFLVARIGSGEINAAVTAKFQQAQVIIEENVLENEAKTIADNSLSIPDAPILCSISCGKKIGVTGDRTDEIQLVRNIITELAAAHSYDELKIIALIPEHERSEWDWIRWLPHCADEQREKRYIFSSKEDAEEALDAFEDMLNRRKAENEEFHGADAAATLPHFVFIVAAYPWIEKHPIRKMLLSDLELGCSSIFVYDRLSILPKECGQIIHVSEGQGEKYNRLNSAQRVKFCLDQFSLADADRFARALAPVYTETEGAASSLPSSVSFLEGYGVNRPEQLNLAQRWNKSKTFRSLSVPIAVIPGGEQFCFDIHETRHGTNGIVAGMPGSGKTEMVQSWLLSLAINFSPQDVSFVLIDFKGTGMIAPFRNLPHLAGSISNLDTTIDRNLIAIRSEISRREAVLDKYSSRSIKNINDLNRNYSQGLVSERLPILIVVIDEYAEFKKNFPDFGAEIDSLTSKGRALGVFVVLMTQKPAGVVSTKSEDNIKFRWCLRVANYGASREMLGKPDAARITNPGRAYIKVGEDDIYEQVQSFWSGAPYEPDKDEQTDAITPISRIKLNGKRIPCEYIEKRKTTKGHEAEIDAVVRYIAAYCQENGIPCAEKVWTERLPERISLAELLPAGFNGRVWPGTKSTMPAIGLVDDPVVQRQYPLTLDLAKVGHTVIYGAPVTGKTTLLQSLIMSIAMTRKPDEVSIYIMDFGGWNLNILKELPHVGGIANDNEPERMNKLSLLLSDLLVERKSKLSKAGVGNISAYRNATGENLPDVILVLDNFGPVLKMYPEMDSFFINLTSSGANYGIYLVATASASSAVPFKISQNIKNALALQMIEKSDYHSIVGSVKANLPPIMGRGLVKGTPPLEFQAALPTPGQDDKTVSDNIRRIAAAMRKAWHGTLPAMIPEMPEEISYGSVKGSGICLGLSVDKVVPVCYDFTKQHFLLISGTEQSGKSNLLQVIAKQLKETLGGSLYVFNVKETALPDLQAVTDAHLTAAAQINDFIESIRPELQRRHMEKQSNPQAAFDALIIAVDDYSQFFQKVSNDSISRLLAMVKLGSGLGIYLIVADDAYALTSLVNKGEAVSLAMSKGKQAVLLGGCLNDHSAIQTKAAFSQKSVAVKEGEGFFINNTAYTVFQAMRSTGGSEA